MSVAALDLGVTKVTAVDFDPVAVDVTRSMLRQYHPEADWHVFRADVLQDDFDTHDFVYSWGVLHHTGNMSSAITRTPRWVATDGVVVIGIYKKYPSCRFWTKVKRWYVRAPSFLKLLSRIAYGTAVLASLAVQGRNPVIYVRTYSRQRGMSWRRDIDDWLGGYPYESASVEDVTQIAFQANLGLEAVFPAPDGRGLLGSGVQTYRFKVIGTDAHR